MLLKDIDSPRDRKVARETQHETDCPGWGDSLSIDTAKGKKVPRDFGNQRLWFRSKQAAEEGLEFGRSARKGKPPELEQLSCWCGVYRVDREVHAHSTPMGGRRYKGLFGATAGGVRRWGGRRLRPVRRPKRGRCAGARSWVRCGRRRFEAGVALLPEECRRGGGRSRVHWSK